jgi:hypothetical protein
MTGFPSDQHVGLVGVTLLGIGLVVVAVGVSQENAVIAAIGGVVQIGTGIVGFLGGRSVGRNEALASGAMSPSSSKVVGGSGTTTTITSDGKPTESAETESQKGKVIA